jgi:hypothetical protein
MAATGFKGVTVGNVFYITGVIIMDGDLHDKSVLCGWDSFSDRDDILRWEDAKQGWERLGSMKIARSYHAVAVIEMEDEVMRFCQ